MTPVVADLDHLAVAAETQAALWPRYRGELGGEWYLGGPGYGFMWGQLQYANGMKVEALAPWQWEQNDFLRRFIDTRGPGPHHMTFKVTDIIAALAAADAAGYRPIGVDLRDPDWKEAFLHPKDAPGVVIQFAQSTGDYKLPAVPDLPAADVTAASLDYVGHAVTDFAVGTRLFGDLLGGREIGRGHDELLGAPWVELAWNSGGVVRLLEMPAWLGDEPGRPHHVAFTTTDPARLVDAIALPDGRYEVAPEHNLGTRLILSAS